jgi:hypothetical protein
MKFIHPAWANPGLRANAKRERGTFMSKQPTTKSSGPNAADALVQVIETVLPFRTNGTPTVDLIARLAAQSVRLLKLNSEDGALAQNAATFSLMKKFKLLAE